MNKLVIRILYLIFTFATAEKMKNYYQGAEIPSEGKYVSKVPKAEFFKQKLNHFNPIDNTTWLQVRNFKYFLINLLITILFLWKICKFLQTYWENKSEYRDGGPVFLLINGEAPASPVWMSSGSWLAYGKELNAMYFLVEHRFYGSSRPTEYVFEILSLKRILVSFLLKWAPGLFRSKGWLR